MSLSMSLGGGGGDGPRIETASDSGDEDLSRSVSFFFGWRVTFVATLMLPLTAVFFLGGMMMNSSAQEIMSS